MTKSIAHLKPSQILYEDNHLLAINKPAEIATMGALEGQPTIHAMAADYLKRKYDKPGNVYVGIVSRLDAMTTGALVMARTSKAASRLSNQFAGDSIQGSEAKKRSKTKASTPAEKLYLVIVEGDFSDTSGQIHGELSDWVRKDDSARRMRLCSPSHAEAKNAVLRYVVLSKFPDCTVLAVRLVTGRKHQIRLQFSDRGHPVLGDKKYGSRRNFPIGVALHCWQLLITHPTINSPLRIVAELPKSWERYRDVIDAADSATRISDTIGWSYKTPTTPE